MRCTVLPVHTSPQPASISRVTRPPSHADLLVAVGKPEEVIAKVAPSADRLTVLTQDEVTSEERAVDAEVKTAVGSRGELRRVWGHTLYHLADLPFRCVADAIARSDSTALLAPSISRRLRHVS